MITLKKTRAILLVLAIVFMAACSTKQSENAEETAVENAAEDAESAKSNAEDAIESADVGEISEATEATEEAKENANTYVDEAGNTVYKFAEQMPSFVGGDEARNNYLSKNLKYPKSAKDAGNEGRVLVEFVVNEDGSIGAARVVKALEDESLNEEAMRVVSEMPAWEPGKQNGENVKVAFTLPIQFKLN